MMFVYINTYKVGLNDRVNFGNDIEEGRIDVGKVYNSPPPK